MTFAQTSDQIHISISLFRKRGPRRRGRVFLAPSFVIIVIILVIFVVLVLVIIKLESVFISAAAVASSQLSQQKVEIVLRNADAAVDEQQKQETLRPYVQGGGRGVGGGRGGCRGAEDVDGIIRFCLLGVDE